MDLVFCAGGAKHSSVLSARLSRPNRADAHTLHQTDRPNARFGIMQRILIIDDDVQVRTLLRDILTFEGFTVIEAGDGAV